MIWPFFALLACAYDWSTRDGVAMMHWREAARFVWTTGQAMYCHEPARRWWSLEAWIICPENSRWSEYAPTVQGYAKMEGGVTCSRPAWSHHSCAKAGILLLLLLHGRYKSTVIRECDIKHFIYFWDAVWNVYTSVIIYLQISFIIFTFWSSWWFWWPWWSQRRSCWQIGWRNVFCDEP